MRTTNSIDDYAATSGTTRQWANQSNHAQEGDPVKLAGAIIEIATTPEPPLRIQFGADCIARVEEKLAKVADEMKRWRKLSLSTGFKSAA